jgi:hypothetical protein
MQKTIALCTHNRPIHSQTNQALHAIRRAGAALIDHADAPTDVTLGRNLGLSAACAQLDRMPGRDLVLLVDDDIVFTLADAQALADHARATGWPASAMYSTRSGELAASEWGNYGAVGARPLWLTGLGLIAIPAAKLLALRSASECFDEGDKYGFTRSGVDGGQYLSEDFTLCKRLGGVHLLPVPVGHVKTIAIYPNDETVKAIREGRAPSTVAGGRWRAAFLRPVRSELTGLTDAEYSNAGPSEEDN